MVWNDHYPFMSFTPAHFIALLGECKDLNVPFSLSGRGAAALPCVYRRGCGGDAGRTLAYSARC